jgi:DNA-directed RNA polymerase omega subunit
MGYQPLEKLLPQANMSIYKLIITASKRSLELAEGMPKLIENPSTDKPATVALEEIVAGKVKLKTEGKKEK